MRIDKYLWFARFAKSRTLAQELVSEGRMRIDGRLVERASCPVRPGTVMTFALRGRVRVIRVEALPARRSPANEAALCYTDLSPMVDVAIQAT